VNVKAISSILNLHLSSVDVKNEWIYTSDCPLCCLGMVKDNFALYLPR